MITAAFSAATRVGHHHRLTRRRFPQAWSSGTRPPGLLGYYVPASYGSTPGVSTKSASGATSSCTPAAELAPRSTTALRAASLQLLVFASEFRRFAGWPDHDGRFPTRSRRYCNASSRSGAEAPHPDSESETPTATVPPASRNQRPRHRTRAEKREPSLRARAPSSR
jgi:hypothetical protein